MHRGTDGGAKLTEMMSVLLLGMTFLTARLCDETVNAHVKRVKMNACVKRVKMNACVKQATMDRGLRPKLRGPL